MRAIIGAVVVLGFAGFVIGQDKDKIDIKKLIGKWEPKEQPKGTSIVIEFADKGKLVLTVDGGGKNERVEGTYTVDGNKIDVAMTIGGKEQKETITVEKLTD